MTLSIRKLAGKTSTFIKSNDTHERVNNNVAVKLCAKFFHSTLSIDDGKLLTTAFLLKNE